MPQITTESFAVGWKSKEDMINFVELAMKAPAKQLGLEVTITEIGKTTSAPPTPKQIELVRL